VITVLRRNLTVVDNHQTTRRRLLHISGSVFLQLGLLAPAVLSTQKSWAQRSATPVCGKATPPQIAGPFFTPQSPERSSLIETGMTASRMRLRGQVVDTACKPIPGALIDCTEWLGAYPEWADM
jgi:protocatechuate 3,4-dioxygenase beta subunit